MEKGITHQATTEDADLPTSLTEAAASKDVKNGASDQASAELKPAEGGSRTIPNNWRQRILAKHRKQIHPPGPMKPREASSKPLTAYYQVLEALPVKESTTIEIEKDEKNPGYTLHIQKIEGAYKVIYAHNKSIILYSPEDVVHLCKVLQLGIFTPPLAVDEIHNVKFGLDQALKINGKLYGFRNEVRNREGGISVYYLNEEVEHLPIGADKDAQAFFQTLPQEESEIPLNILERRNYSMSQAIEHWRTLEEAVAGYKKIVGGLPPEYEKTKKEAIRGISPVNTSRRTILAAAALAAAGAISDGGLHSIFQSSQPVDQIVQSSGTFLPPTTSPETIFDASEQKEVYSIEISEAGSKDYFRLIRFFHGLNMPKAARDFEEAVREASTGVQDVETSAKTYPLTLTDRESADATYAYLEAAKIIINIAADKYENGDAMNIFWEKQKDLLEKLVDQVKVTRKYEWPLTAQDSSKPKEDRSQQFASDDQNINNFLRQSGEIGGNLRRTLAAIKSLQISRKFSDYPSKMDRVAVERELTQRLRTPELASEEVIDLTHHRVSAFLDSADGNPSTLQVAHIKGNRIDASQKSHNAHPKVISSPELGAKKNTFHVDLNPKVNEGIATMMNISNDQFDKRGAKKFYGLVQKVMEIFSTTSQIPEDRATEFFALLEEESVREYKTENPGATDAEAQDTSINGYLSMARKNKNLWFAGETEMKAYNPIAMALQYMKEVVVMEENRKFFPIIQDESGKNPTNAVPANEQHGFFNPNTHGLKGARTQEVKVVKQEKPQTPTYLLQQNGTIPQNNAGSFQKQQVPDAKQAAVVKKEPKGLFGKAAAAIRAIFA